MDSTAVNSIADQAVANLKNVEGAVTLPERYKLVSTESFNSVPYFYRAKFNTNVIGEFISYINDNAVENTAVFIDQDRMQSKAIIDIGTKEDPEWGYHQASISLKKTAAYAALLQCADDTLHQQQFIDFLEDWQDFVVFYDESSTQIGFSDAIKTLRRLKVSAKAEAEHSINNFSASRSALENIEITAGTEKLPAYFIFATPPHEGFNQIEFICQLRATSTEKTVSLKFRISSLEVIKEGIGFEFRDKILAETTTDSIAIYIGSLDYQ